LAAAIDDVAADAVGEVVEFADEVEVEFDFELQAA